MKQRINTKQNKGFLKGDILEMKICSSKTDRKNKSFVSLERVFESTQDENKTDITSGLSNTKLQQLENRWTFPNFVDEIPDTWG